MEQLRIKELSEFEKIDMINRLTAQLDASRALLAERDKLIENQQAEIESRNQLRYDAIRGEHSRSPYYYDSWCKLHDHKGVIGTSDKPPIHYAVNLLNRLTEQLAERDAEIRRLSRLLEIIRAGDVLDRAEKAEIGNASLRAEAERLKVDAEEIYKAYNYAVDEQISLKAKIAFWQSENVALRAEIARLQQQSVGWVQVFDENAALRAEVERMKLIISGKTFVDERKLVAQEIIQYIIDQGKVAFGSLSARDYVYDIIDSDIEELRQRYGLEG